MVSETKKIVSNASTCFSGLMRLPIFFNVIGTAAECSWERHAMMSSLLPVFCTVEILSFHFNLALRGHRGENACIKMLYDIEEKYMSQKWSVKRWLVTWIKKILE
jgi:hypothetical protein